MLCKFTFSNYKVFKNTVCLDMLARFNKDGTESVIVDALEGERILPIAAIYGGTGSGKSTVLEALIFLKIFLTQQMIFSDIQTNIDRKYARILNQYSMNLKNKYHRYTEECKDIPMTFEITFRIAQKEFLYQLSMIETVIVEEKLYVRALTTQQMESVFERSENHCILGKEADGIVVHKIKNSMPLLTHIAMNYEIASVNEAITWFKSVRVADKYLYLLENQIVLPKEEKCRKQICKILQCMDIDIIDYRLEKDLNGNAKNIYIKHKLLNGSVIEIPFEEESSGIKKLFSCLAEIIECLDEGLLMVADELDTNLHSKLLKIIVELFTNLNTNQRESQLLLTSHDTSIMKPEILRRDEIWFCDKDNENASKLYSAMTSSEKMFYKEKMKCID